MCNEYKSAAPRELVARAFADYGIPLTFVDAPTNRPPLQPIKPTHRATIIRPQDPLQPSAALEALDLRWKLVPFFHKGALADFKPMTTNARIETVDTAPTYREAYKRRRCLVPLTSFIEYDEPPGWKKGDRKRRWEITWPAGDVRYFAGLWERAHPTDQPDGLESFAFVTGPAAADVAPVHDRTPPVLTLAEGMEWLKLDGPGKELLTPSPPGALILAERPREMDLG